MPAAPASLEQRVVLCVGGRGGSVPQYRQAVEGCGAQFLHHDGGSEHKPAQLEPQLAAADLVICQTGCISPDAYWRVKDHCKRHGKLCVFGDTPSRTAFERALAQAAAEAGALPLAVTTTVIMLAAGLVLLWRTGVLRRLCREAWTTLTGWAAAVGDDDVGDGGGREPGGQGP